MPNNGLVDLVANARLREEVTRKLGDFASVFGADIDHFFKWGKFPAPLIKDALGYTPDGTEMQTPYDPQKYADLTYKAANFTFASLVDKKVPYHGIEHNLAVANNIAVIDEQLEELVELEGPLFGEIVKQTSHTAGLFHDAFHHGESARVGERGKMHRPELGKEGEVTLEEVSALESDRLLAELKFPLPARLFNIALILATHRNVGPLSYQFARIRLADISPVGDFPTVIRNQIVLNYGRINPELEVINGIKPAMNIRGVADDVLRFKTGVLAPQMDHFDRIVYDLVENEQKIPERKRRKVLAALNKASITEQLGMRKLFAREIKDLTALQQGSARHMGLLKARLKEFGLETDADGQIYYAPGEQIERSL